MIATSDLSYYARLPGNRERGMNISRNTEKCNYESRKDKSKTERNTIFGTERNTVIGTEKYNYRSHTEARFGFGLRCHLRIGADMEPARFKPNIFSSSDTEK